MPLYWVGLAFKRYAPNVASQVAGYIPGVVKQPVNYVAQTGIGRVWGIMGESLLTHSEGWLGQLKIWLLAGSVKAFNKRFKSILKILSLRLNAGAFCVAVKLNLRQNTYEFGRFPIVTTA